MAMTEEYTDPYQATLQNTDVQSYFNPPKQGNTTTFTPHMEPLPPQEAVQSKPQPPTTKEYMDAIMGGFPEPTYPKASQDRIQRIMKTKALGQGLGALGDIFALSQGARVNRRQPDQSISRYRQLFEHREDDYLRRMDDHSRQQFNLKLQGLQFGIQRGDREQDMNFRDKQFDQSQENFDKQFDFGVEKTNAANKLAFDKMVADMAYKGMTAKERERHNKATEGAAWLRANKTGTSSDKSYNIYGTDGKAVELANFNEAMKVVQLIINDPNINKTVIKEDLDLLTAGMGDPMSNNAVNSLIQKYWEYSPAVKSYLENRGGISSTPAPAGIPLEAGFSPTKPAGTPVTPTPGVTKPVNPTNQTGNPTVTPPATKPQAPAQMQLQKDDEQPVLPSAKEISSKYQGYDMTKQKPSSIAYDMAEKQGIPTNQRPAWIAAKAKEIQKDFDTLRMVQNLGYDSSAGKEIPAPQYSTGGWY